MIRTKKKYYPTKPKEPFTYRELVVFQSAACLPWGIISLQPHALKLTQITFDSVQAENINAPLDESGNTLLHQAIKKNKPHEHIQTLMDVGADYKTRNQKGERPIDLAPKETQLFMERYHKTLKNLTLQRTKGRLRLLEQRITDLESRQLPLSAQSDTFSSDQPPSRLTPFALVKK